MFKNVHKVYYNSPEDRQAGLDLYTTLSTFDAKLSAYIQQHINDQLPVLVINGAATLPPYWEQRLLQPMVEHPDINRISALNISTHQLAPLIEDFEGTLSQLDQWVYLLQKPAYFFVDSCNQNCFAVREAQFLNTPNIDCAVNNLVVDLPTTGALIAAPKPPDVGDQRPLPTHPLLNLQLKLSQINLSSNQAGLNGDRFPALDQRPTLLHVVMDWGGGVHKWINDFITNHGEFNHLVLCSQGEFYRQRHGERLSLRWQHCDGPEISSYPLSDPIHATCIHQPEYQQVLELLIERWQVTSLLVSSLIGHSMDCLTTGLPTLRVLHDYFPHWPSLNARLDVAQVEPEHLASALDQTVDEPFGAITEAQLTAWQQAQNKLLSQPNITLVAPDASVKDNLLKLSQSACFQNLKVIPHATKPLSAIDYQTRKSSLHIVLLGRITAAKGAQLLHDIITRLAGVKGLQWTLLGAGKEGAKFAGYQNLEVIENYPPDQLRDWLQKLQPQLGLITATTAETFSYILTEMQMLGLPVLGTSVGAIKNRIEDGINGLLVAPDAQLMATKILHLQQHPEALMKLHQGALQTQHSSIEQNITAYRELLAATDPTPPVYNGVTLLQPNPQTLYSQQLWQQRKSVAAELAETKRDLVEKISWAKAANQQNEHLTHNLELARIEVTQIKQDKAEQAQTYETEISKLNANLNDLQQHLAHLNQQLEALSQVERQLHTAEGTIRAMQASRSWRITKPLRSTTTYLRHKRNAAKFRFSQLKSLPRRVRNSLHTRGLKETAKMATNKLKKATPKSAVTAHQVTENYRALTIQSSSKPQVSIIIPVYNQFKHTYHCLESLARLTDHTAFEVWVIDDCSNDETQTAIQAIKGIHYHRQAQNGGFIESCNTGASQAQGEFLLFLNNDTEVLPGWLDELLATFKHRPDAGLVGSQLLYPDGRLQEAGGIVFSDGSGWNYGRLDTPGDPEYQHLRAVSYISGASIMIRNALFKQLGQFDQRYKPAYYEDTDLAFAVRQAGKQVYYQPLSRVIHFEGISSGTDLSTGTKKYQVTNQAKFLEKWQTTLAKQPAPGSDIELARFQNQAPRVLILDACTPTPDQDSGSLRMLNLMQILIELGHQVSFIPENMAFFDAYTERLQRLGVECVYAPKYSSTIDYLKAKGHCFQTVVLSRYYVAEPVMPAIRSYCPDAKLWFDTVDLHYVRETRMAELAQDSTALKAAQITKQKELAVAKNCDLTLVVSPYEQQVLAEEQADLKVAVLSNIHEVYGSENGHNDRRDLVFLGGYQHTPNVDGLLWFVAEIWPSILAAIPDIILHVVGSKAPQQVIDLGQQPNIKFHGFVEDIEPFMQTIRIAVAPLRFGAGVKGKVNMSMSHGQPVVGTKVAVEGMYTKSGHDVMMADDPDEFAAAVIALYQDAELWQRIAAGGLENVQKWFSFDAAKATIQKLLSTQ